MYIEEGYRMLEVCCGSYYDALQAYAGGARRIELNSALNLGGLTPSVATLELVKQDCGSMKVITMVRPRGAGFCYSDEDFRVMEAECRMLLQHGADGIAFGCLNKDATLNMEQNKRLVSMILENGKEAVFHRAFDCSSEPFGTMEALIRMGVNRVLTSGLKPTAPDGKELIGELQQRYGEQIEILAGSGINAANAVPLMADTGISQVHSSCKDWMEDETTIVGAVSYSYAPVPHASCYEVVSADKVREILAAIAEWENLGQESKAGE